MKQIPILLIVFMCLMSSVCFGDDVESQSDLVKLGKLVSLEKQAVQTYQGYKLTVNWVGDRPSIDIVQQQVNTNSKKIIIKNVVQIDVKKSVADEKEIESKLLALTTFKPAKVIESSNNSLGQFDAYDENGRVRITQWRDFQNGFNLKTLFFDETGKVMSMTYFYKLQINKPFSAPYSGKVVRVSLEKAIRENEKFDYRDPQSVIDFSEKFLERVLEKN